MVDKLWAKVTTDMGALEPHGAKTRTQIDCYLYVCVRACVGERCMVFLLNIVSNNKDVMGR